MKRLLAIIMVACTVGLCACAANPRCEFDAVYGALEEAEKVSCCVYGEDGEFKLYEVDSEPLCGMVKGKWEKISQPDDFDKIASITVGTQYEIGFFEGGKAIIYSGYAGVFERDRQYYSVELEGDVKDICNYASENGSEVEIEE